MIATTYRGYAARIEFSEEDACFVGHLAGIRDIVGFHGESIEEAMVAFHEAVDDYLAACEQLGAQPNTPDASTACASPPNRSP